MPRVAIVTGGTDGIGAAAAEQLRLAGYSPIATYGHNDKVAREFTSRTGIAVRKWDVANYPACEAGVSEIEATFGPINVLINNAGIAMDCMLHKMASDQWHRVIETDLTGCFNMCRVVINGMRERRFGRIVNVSSVNGQAGQLGQVNYAAAKAGMIGFTKSLALESAERGITVNAVAPGYTDTPMVAHVPPDILKTIIAKIPIGRLALPSEIAHAIAFLASDEAAYITGATLTINGGLYLT
jgi:acetoacetyl-CoA reductase